MRWTVLAIVLLGGCLDSENVEPPVASDDEQGTNQGEGFTGSHLFYNGSSSSTVTQLFVGGGSGFGLGGSNCLHIDDSVSVIHSGWVEANWTSAIPDLGMELRAVTDPPRNTTGTSPLRLDLADARPDSFFEDISIALLPLAGTGAHVDLELTFTFELTDYDGPEEPGWKHEGLCAFG